ncbi:MAG: UDP-N-acetylmuramoyl-tripeptide--D-alanyl-D-alanine ligase [Bacillota bacterium]|nr:UDP-N-acetylmuramoyl-tripeptide--D-alanyl-D-alanine ligase [Bacillota bacterium]
MDVERLGIEEITAAVGGSIYYRSDFKDHNEVCIDTRKLQQGDIYIAIKGENFNGNKFVEEASQKGASICIVEEIAFDVKNLKESTIILVADTKKALRELAKFYRSRLRLKVIGVTGSTGKTTTKDLIAAALSSRYKVFKTKGNFNNEIGLPLMIFKLDNSFDVAVLEMGMSNFGEIHNLADIARPDIAVITNIGISHIENLGSRENILKAKLEITDFFGKSNTLIVNGEDDLLGSLEDERYILVKAGFGEEFYLHSKNISLYEDGIEYNVVKGNEASGIRVRIDIPGKHNVLNSLLAYGCGNILGLRNEEICSGFKNLEATSMRLDIINCGKFKIINDCYNASPDSMKAALEVQTHMEAKRRIAVLGTMRELGHESYNAHKEVAEFAREKGIDLLIVLGEYGNAYKEGFQRDKDFMHMDSAEGAAELLKGIIKEGDLVLFKASRAMKFESIIEMIK